MTLPGTFPTVSNAPARLRFRSLRVRPVWLGVSLPRRRIRLATGRPSPFAMSSARLKPRMRSRERCRGTGTMISPLKSWLSRHCFKMPASGRASETRSAYFRWWMISRNVCVKSKVNARNQTSVRPGGRDRKVLRLPAPVRRISGRMAARWESNWTSIADMPLPTCAPERVRDRPNI
jgi:hypothetical protein